MTGKQIKPVFARRILAIFSNGYSRGDLGADLRAGVINAINGLLKKEANQLVIAGLKMAARMRTSSSATAVPAGCFYSHISLCAKKRGVFQKLIQSFFVFCLQGGNRCNVLLPHPSTIPLHHPGIALSSRDV